MLWEAKPDPAYNHTEKAIEYMNRQVKGGRTHWDFALHSDATNAKSACLVAVLYKGVPYNVLIDQYGTIRKFMPVECERLQNVPANYTKGVSNTQRYKMLGNGWTVDVIAHILKHLKSL
jgi:site-specific DNA-cytosine methylase